MARKSTKPRHDPDNTACRCQSCITTRAWREGAFANRRVRRALDAWSAEEDALLHKLSGEYTVAEIAGRITRQTGNPRTERATRIRMTILGISAILHHHALDQVAHIFGASHYSVRRWVRWGMLAARRIHADRPKSHFVITDEGIDEFLRSCPHLYDWRNMPHSRWRSVAQVTQQTNPVYTIRRAAEVLGVSRDFLYDAIHTGRVAALKKPGPTGGVTRLYVTRTALAPLRRSL